ncbi:DNA replication complex gins protein psf2, partial [Globisporangium splendens]
MTTSARWNALTASETEFLAEHELITILPHFQIRENGGVLNFIGPGITTQVPLWLAIMLKQLNKCRIIQPSWFSVEFLSARLEQEKNSEIFEELPFHYLEISSLLFKNAAEDIEHVEHIRSLLEDIQNVRQDKIRNGLYKISSDVQNGGTAYAIQMNNISALEINSVRQFMVGSLNKFYRLATLNAEHGASNSDDFEGEMTSGRRLLDPDAEPNVLGAFFFRCVAIFTWRAQDMKLPMKDSYKAS